MNVAKEFVQSCKRDQEKSEAITAIEILTQLIRQTNFSTVQQVDEFFVKAISEMRQTETSNFSVTSACAIFQKFISPTDLDGVDDVKPVLLQRATEFLEKICLYRNQIALYARNLLQTNGRLFIHSRSRVVLNTLATLPPSVKTRLHCYVTTCSIDASGKRMAGDLANIGISYTLIPDTAIAYIMPRVDVVLLGAEAVVESGGILSRLGSCTIAMIAHELGKPVHVLAESFKCLRVFILDQRYVIDHLNAVREAASSIAPTDAMPHPVANFPELNSIWNEVESQKVSDIEKVIPPVDYTDPKYITSLITDMGMLTPSVISDELIKLYL